MPSNRRTIYFRPLARRGGALGNMTISQKSEFIRDTTIALKQAIRHEASKERWFKKPGPKFFSDIKIDPKENSVTITMQNAPLYQNNGVRKYQMTHLRGLTVRFKPRGKNWIFRTVSDRSLKRGGWTHPGYPGKRFVDRAVNRVKDIMADKIARSVIDSLLDDLGDE